MARSKAGRGGRRTSDLGFPSARSTVGRRSGSPPKQRPSVLFGGDAAYHTANSPPVGRVPSHADRFAESLRRISVQYRCKSQRHNGLVSDNPAALLLSLQGHFSLDAGIWRGWNYPPIATVSIPCQYRSNTGALPIQPQIDTDEHR